MDNKFLDNLAEYLFPGEHIEDSKNLFKSFYHGKPQHDYAGSAGEMLKAACDGQPAGCRLDLSMAYSLTQNITPNFIRALEADRIASKRGETSKMRKPLVEPEKAAQDALNKAFSQFAIAVDAGGQVSQDDLMGKVTEDAVLVLGGLIASKNPSALDVGQQLKRIDTSTKTLEKTLKNISAIADALLKGLVQIRSEWAETGYDYGRDLSKIDASEFANLATPATKQLFLLKLAKGELLQESSQDKKGLGDMIIAFDTSGSAFSNTKQGYEIVDLEVGIAYAMCKIAARNKCKSYVLPYHTSCYYQSDWMRDADSINSYFAKMFSGSKLKSGGTSFDSALSRIAKLFEDQQFPTKRKPGIIFITDGYDSVLSSTKEKINDLRRKLGIKLFSYFVSDTDPRKYSKDLLSISDASFWINSDKPISKQIEAFEQIR